MNFSSRGSGIPKNLPPHAKTPFPAALSGIRAASYSFGAMTFSVSIKACLFATLAAHAMLVVGCQTDGEKFRDLTKQINTLTIEKIDLENRLVRRDADIAALEGRMQNLRGQGLAPPAPAFVVDHIEILKITTGADLDDTPGDDHVTVYFRPLDQDGDPFKTGGAVKIKLLDNRKFGTPTLLGPVAVFNQPERLRKMWYGKFITSFFKADVPFFPNADLGPDQEVDIHLTFEEFATGRTFTARHAVRINHPRPSK